MANCTVSCRPLAYRGSSDQRGEGEPTTARRFGSSKYGIDRTFRVLMDLLTV